VLEQCAEILHGRAVTASEKECSGILASIDATTKMLKKAISISPFYLIPHHKSLGVGISPSRCS